MKVTGKIEDVVVDYKSGVPRVTLSINERSAFLMSVDELRAMDLLLIEMKQFRPKRSLDANAYAWVLIHKLAEKLNQQPAEIYREAIRNIGGNSEVVCVKNDAVDKVKQGWTKNGLGWQAETFPSKLEGCTNIILYYGSSEYDTAQMSRLIDNIVQDCEALGIETKTPDELAKLIGLWGEKKDER